MVVESYAISQFERERAWDVLRGAKGEGGGVESRRKRTAATKLGRWVRHAATVVVICYSCNYMVKTVGFELEIDHGR